MKNIFALKHNKKFLFLIVGSCGFLVDLTAFYIAFEYFKIDVIAARIVAFIFAVMTTWFGNKTLTFKDRQKKASKVQFGQAFITATVALIPNMAVFMLVQSYLQELVLGPYIALVSGIIVGLFINYTLSNKWVFK